MDEQVSNYKCPACNAGLKFDASSGMLACEYCDSKFAVAEIEAMYANTDRQAAEAFSEAEAEVNADGGADGEWDTSDLKTWDVGEGMKAYNCPACGAQLICEETTAATSCPYCGNPGVVPGQFSGGLKPDYIIPFKYEQNSAVEALKKHYTGKRLLPNSFTSENRIKEIKGIYVPFWLFDGEVDADVKFEATRSRCFRQGDYEITETEHFNVHRAGTVPFSMIPVDGSSKMEDSYMDAIEPFDYSQLERFSTAYLPGYLADKYDMSVDDCAPRADERAYNTAVETMRDTVKGYDTCTVSDKSLTLRRAKAHYGLLPVYMLSTVWNGQKYMFAMNGQTGKLIGDLPIDRAKYWKYFWGITAAVTVLLGTALKLLLY